MASDGANGHSGVDTGKYIKWNAEGVEKIPPNEAEDIKAVADMINQMQQKQINNHRHCYSGTHARTQGIVKGKLIVKELPQHLAQTLFSKLAEYPIAMRYSTEPGDPGIDDRIPQPRGLGMKVFNVQGEMFDAGKDFPTQDIEFNNAPALELADAKTTREIFEIRIKYGDDKKDLYKQLEARDDTDLQKARDQLRNTHLESFRMYSQSAFRFGDYVVKYSLVPSGETQKKAHEETVDPDSHPNNILSQWLQEFYSKHDAEYLFQVQFLENLDEQPVEYAGTPWDDAKYPWQTVAKVIVPKQESFLPSRKTFWEEHIRLDPWHGLKTFQPLGSSNRLRRGVYPASAGFRHKMIARKEINVTSIDQIPDGGFVTG
ncbi:heme-dependent catalase [Mollisia scopiformis]|uniref:Heme-dependent catalase n=1 Tax=Mollisia scopiformis TaxID=149040 RepID=A0A194WWP6_MOLSC|nr:heme-dependent catalase [Mollisia scopiformis]KUJ12109.1 heme-dependent catalase [Mollisia scopiformis]